jgi:hypothetical protein
MISMIGIARRSSPWCVGSSARLLSADTGLDCRASTEKSVVDRGIGRKAVRVILQEHDLKPPVGKMRQLRALG